MKRLDYIIVLAAIMAVLAYVLGGWLVKAVVAIGSLGGWAVYAQRYRLYGLSLYLSALFLSYLCADMLAFADISIGAYISYAIFCTTLGGCITLARQGSAMLQVFTVLTNTVFIILPTFYIGHYVVFSAEITRDVYHGMLQTNVAEAIEFARTTGITEHLPVPAVCIILITFFLCRYLRREKMIRTHTAKIFLLLVLIAATGWSGTSKLTTDTGPRVTRDLGLYTIRYYNRLRLFKRRTAARDISKVKYTATKAGKGETYVFVIGESLNKHHLQIYGYPRATTPNLAAERELLIFNNAYSSHIHTAHALVKALTVANQYNGLEWYEAVSIIDIARKANMTTFWISNQNLFSFFISAITLFAQHTDHHQHLGDAFYDSPHYDEVLFPHVARVLAEDTQDNRIIFVHLMGNHADYCLRFTAEYARFTGKLPVSTYGRITQSKPPYHRKVNCYDNSVLYNDFVVSQMLSMVKKRTGVNGFIYFSDHADDVLGDEVKVMHSFSYQMTSIPLIMWFSSAYRQKYPHAYQNLQNNRDKLFSGDLLYDTLLGVMAIDSDKYNAHADLSSSSYQLKDSEALVLNGQHKYEDNIRWRQQKHIAALVAAGDGHRAIPSQVNNIGKLKEVWRDGSRAFAIDLTYRDSCLVVEATDMCLLDFLSHVDMSQIKKLWLRGKSLPVDNLTAALAEIKARVPAAAIVADIGNCADNSSAFKTHGQRLSCVLSQPQLRTLPQHAAALAQQLAKQGVSALSFEARFYPQVREHFEHQPGVVFHLHSDKGVAELQHATYWLDPRVKTVAFDYHSLFQLPTRTAPKKYAAQKLPRP